MPTFDFNLPIDEIIEEAYELAGQDQTGAQNMRSARRSVNLLFIDLQNRNIPLSHLEKISIPMVKGQAEYTLDVKVLDVMNAVINRDGTDIPMVRMSLFDYNHQPAKTQEGRAITFTIDRQKTAPILTVWPTSDNNTDVIEAWVFRKNADVTSYTDFVDIATRYLPAMVIGLAARLAMKNPKLSVEEKLMLSGSLNKEYDIMLGTAFEEDRERTSVFFTPQVPKGY